MRQFVIASGLMLLIAACSDGNKRVGGNAGSQLPGSLGTALMVAAYSTADIAGTYSGVLPCADCEGIETMLQLNDDETYQLEVKYQGKNQSAPFVTKGTWVLGDDRIKLKGVTDAPDSYLIEDDYLVQLDMKGKKIDGALAEQYILKKN